MEGIPKLQVLFHCESRIKYYGQTYKYIFHSFSPFLYFTDSFHVNPQLHLIVPHETNLVLSVCQHNVVEPQVIGFTGYDVTEDKDAALLDAHELPTQQFYKTRRSLVNSQYTNSRQVSLRSRFQPGSYLLLPTTYEPGVETSFIFRIFSQRAIKLKLQDCTPEMTRTPVVRAQETTKSLTQYQGLFIKLADEQKSVNPFELQELLEICLPNGTFGRLLLIFHKHSQYGLKD